MPWQTQVAIQLQAGNTIINATGDLVYSGPPAAGNLIASQAPASGTDQFGNHFLAGTTSYSATFAAQLGSGFVSLYTGSLAAGWTSQATIQTSGSGGLFLATSSSQINLNAATAVSTNHNTLDDGSGNMTVAGSLSVGGSTNTGASSNTGFFNTQGLASGSYGSTHQHTLPNFTTATHVHPL